MREQKGYLLHNKSSWFVRFMDDVVQPDGTIKRKLVCKKLDVPYGGQYRSEKSVREFVQKVLQPVNSGRLNPQSTMSVHDFVERIYLPHYIDKDLRPASRKQFRDTWNNHLKSRMVGQTLREFRTKNAQDILNSILEKNNLGRSSMRHCKSAMSGIFKEAKRQGILDNVVNPVKDTKIGETHDADEEDTYAYNLDEIAAMLARLTEPARTVVLTAAFSGLRKSELKGLRWSDFDGSTITVRRSHWNGHESKPKTKKSRAPVKLVKLLADGLNSHKLRQGILAQDVLPIFQSGKGTPLNLENLARRVIRPAIEVCKHCQKVEAEHKPEAHMFELDKSVLWHGWHAFRRGLATNLHELGARDKDIQAVLRHSNVNLTMNIYVKSDTKAQANALDALEAKFGTCNEFATIPAVRPN